MEEIGDKVLSNKIVDNIWKISECIRYHDFKGTLIGVEMNGSTLSRVIYSQYFRDTINTETNEPERYLFDLKVYFNNNLSDGHIGFICDFSK